MRRNEDLELTLKEFEALSKTDRKAILAHLTPLERKALQLTAEQLRQPLYVRALSAHSKWLTRRLLPLVNADGVARRRQVSPAASAALKKALGDPSTARSTAPKLHNAVLGD